MSVEWFQAARAGDLLRLTEGLQANLRTRDWRGRTALFYTTALGHELASFALYDECGVVYDKGETALELAAYTNQPRLFSRLACSQMERRASHLTPLMQACFEADEEAFAAHISELHRRDARGLPALFYAACGNDSEPRRRILARLRPLEGDVKTYEGHFSMFMAAVYYGNLNAAREFMYQAGQTSSAGETALILACKMGTFGDIVTADVPLSKNIEIRDNYMRIIDFMFHTGKIFELEVSHVSHKGLTATEAFLTWMMDERVCSAEAQGKGLERSTVIRVAGGSKSMESTALPSPSEATEPVEASVEGSSEPPDGLSGESQSQSQVRGHSEAHEVKEGSDGRNSRNSPCPSVPNGSVFDGRSRESPVLTGTQLPLTSRTHPDSQLIKVTRALPSEAAVRKFTDRPALLPRKDINVLCTLYFCEMGMVTPAFFKKISQMQDSDRLGKALGLVTGIDLNPLSLLSNLHDPDRLRAILKDTHAEISRVQQAEEAGERLEIGAADPPGLEPPGVQDQDGLDLSTDQVETPETALQPAHQRMAIKCIDVMLTVNARGRNALEEAVERGLIESFSILYPLLGRDCRVDDLMVVAFVDTECSVLKNVRPDTIMSLSGRYDRLGRSAIFYSIYGNNLGTFSILYPYQKTMLLDNFMGGMGGANGLTVLMLSLKLCRFDFVEFILDQEKDSVSSGGVLLRFDSNGLMAIHYALVTFLPEDLLKRLYALEGPVSAGQGVSISDFVFDEVSRCRGRVRRHSDSTRIYNRCKYRALLRNAALLGLEVPEAPGRKQPIRRARKQGVSVVGD